MEIKLFEKKWNSSNLPNIIKGTKTLSRKESYHICQYMEKHKPINMVELGVQLGCSTAIFLEMANWINHKIKLDSWDIVDIAKYPDRNKFTLHVEDITGNEAKMFNEYMPDLVFLDAHAYNMTRKIMQLCLDRKIDFITHDVSLSLLERIRRESNGFVNKDVYVQWESYLIGDLIDKSLWKKDSFENDGLTATCIRDVFGIIIIEHKR